MPHCKTVALVAAAILCLCQAAGAERIKDITTIEGVRSNPLQGLGVVLGLDGTGDGSEITKRAVASAIRKQEGISISPQEISSKNVAAVWVTAELPPFAREGARIDITVATAGSCESLRGGILLLTELKGADGKVYAVAQGPVTVGGFEAKGKAASVTTGFLTVGRVVGGAHVERTEASTFVQEGRITLQLRNPDFATANRITEAINKAFPDSAKALTAGAVRVQVPKDVKEDEIVGFVEKINAIEVEVDQPAVVLINERTGTILIGKNVRISLVAITKGNLSIITEEQEQVSQPTPFSSGGTTEKVDRTSTKAIEERRDLQTLPAQMSVQDLARALNAMGLSPTDLIAIFEALKEQGALQAELRPM